MKSFHTGLPNLSTGKRQEEKSYQKERRNQEQSDNKDESPLVEPDKGMDYNKAGSSDVRKVDKINKNSMEKN